MDKQRMFARNITFTISGPIASQAEIDRERARVQPLNSFLAYLTLPVFIFAVWLGWNAGRFAVHYFEGVGYLSVPTIYLSGGCAGVLAWWVIMWGDHRLTLWAREYSHGLKPLGTDRVNSASKLISERHEFEEYRSRVVALRALCNGDIECLEQYKEELERNQVAAQEELDRQEDLEALAALNRPSKLGDFDHV